MSRCLKPCNLVLGKRVWFNAPVILAYADRRVVRHISGIHSHKIWKLGHSGQKRGAYAYATRISYSDRPKWEYIPDVERILMPNHSGSRSTCLNHLFTVTGIAGLDGLVFWKYLQ